MKNNEYESMFDDLLEGEVSLTEKQWKIIEAAIEVFSEKGYEGSRTSDIAKRANVAEGTIFRYFKTKKELLLGLMFPFMLRVMKPVIFQPVEQLMENNGQSIEETLKQFALNRLKLARQNLPLLKTIFLESTHHPELLYPLQKEFAPKMVMLLDTFAKRRIDDGTFRELNERLITRSIISMLLGYVILTSIFPDLFSLEEDEQEMENIIDILLHGIAQHKEENK